MNYMKKLSELDQKTQDKIIASFKEKGITKNELENKEFEVKERKGELIFSFQGVSISMPAPSQGVIDKIWKDNGSQIVTTLLTLAAVGVGAVITKNNEK